MTHEEFLNKYYNFTTQRWICPYCDDPDTSYNYKRSFGVHLRKYHNKTALDIPKDIITDPGYGVCLNCGGESTFRGLVQGHSNFCSTTCSNNYPKHRDVVRKIFVENQKDPNFRLKNAESIRKTYSDPEKRASCDRQIALASLNEECYFYIWVVDDSFVKIGVTNDPHSRIRNVIPEFFKMNKLDATDLEYDIKVSTPRVDYDLVKHIIQSGHTEVRRIEFLPLIREKLEAKLKEGASTQDD